MEFELSQLRKELGLLDPAPSSAIQNQAVQETQPEAPELVVIGVGKERAQASVRRLLAHKARESSSKHGQPDGLLLLGVAGAVDPKLRTGDLVFSSNYHVDTRFPGMSNNNLADGDPGTTFTPDPIMWDVAIKACALAGREPVYAESLTVDEVIGEPRQKQTIANNNPVGIVEMEDYWVAEVAAEFGVGFLAARTVLDTAHQSLPGWLLGLSRSRLKATISITAMPWRIPTVLRLVRQRPVVQNTLTQFALKFLEEAGKTEGAFASMNVNQAGEDNLKVSA